MKRYNLVENELTLHVKKSPILIRILFFVFTSLFFLAPICGAIINIINGDGFHFAFIIAILLFGLLGFYMLRIALWNTYGKEELTFNGNRITYLANYGWFKDALKTKEITPRTYSFMQVGYEEDNEGVLVIGSEREEIQCVTKMPVEEIVLLIEELNNFDQL